MQTTEFAVDRAAIPWVMPRVYVNYGPIDSVRIEMGIKMMLTEPGAKKNLLIPLTPLANGVVYFAAITRNERSAGLAQYRLEATPTGMYMRIRAIDVPDRVRADYPHITFTTNQLDEVDNQNLFWNILHKKCELMYDTISLSNPQHAVVGGMRLGYDVRSDGWTQVPPTPDQFRAMYGNTMSRRVEISLREMCMPGAVRTSMMVYDLRSKDHSVALLRNGTTINIVDVMVRTYPQLVAFERVVIFHPNMLQMFPGFQFTSVRFTDAEKDTLFQKPVLDHYEALNSSYLMQHYRGPRLTALAMSLHPRLGKDAMGHIGCLGRDVLVIIARMTP